MDMSIRKRLMLSNVATLLFVAACGLIGYQTVHSLDATMDGVRDNGTAIKNQLQADQAHDAIRADVLEALLSAANNDSEQAKQAAKDLADHTALLRARFASMAAKSSAELKQDMAKVGPAADAYLGSAANMVKTAAADKDAVQAAFPAFMQSFRKLEESMGVLSERIKHDSTVAA
ncbi:MAG: MCP four helix bundle domain-containing protein [Bdellovibrionales bacterium]|nr:MCP four helix bundle domain-containing protein [Massilia sp.]